MSGVWALTAVNGTTLRSNVCLRSKQWPCGAAARVLAGTRKAHRQLFAVLTVAGLLLAYHMYNTTR